MLVEIAIPILHPSILILTKLTRWCHNYTSTRPKTRLKNESDSKDIEFLIKWMAKEQILIAFHRYDGKPRTDLLVLVRTYWDRKTVEGDGEIIEVLKSIMIGEDVQEIMHDQRRDGNLAVQASERSSPPP